MVLRVLAGILSAVVTTASAVAQSPFPFHEPVQPPRQTQVVANGGLRMLAPPDSAEAVRECAADYIEWAAIDVRLTKDGRHVVCSDDQVSVGVEGTSRPVAEWTLAELQDIDIGAEFAPRFSGVHRAALGEVLDAARDRVNLVLHCRQVSPAELATEIQAAGMESQVLLSGDPQVLAEVRSHSTSALATLVRWTPGVGSLEELRNTLQPTVIELAARDFGAAKCRTLHAFGISVLVNTLGASTDHSEFWRNATSGGADFVLTDRPAEFRARQTYRNSDLHVQFACHRGASRYAPENTLPAIETAIALGANYIEIDIRTTRDGEFVLVHDGSLNRTTSGTGKVSEQTAAAIAALDAGSWFGKPFAGLKVPTLNEGLEPIVRGENALASPGPYLDAKDIAPEALLAAIREHDLMERHVVYQSIDYCRRLKALDPDVRLLPPLRHPDELDSVAELKPYGVDARWSILSRDLINRCHAQGIKVFSDALGEHETVEEYRQAIAWGIDVIQTDHPLRVLRAIELESAARH